MSKFDKDSKEINNVMKVLGLIIFALVVLGTDMKDNAYIEVAVYFLSALIGMMVAEIIRRDI